MFKQLITAMVITMATATGALAAVKGETVEYKTAEGKIMQGYIAYDDAVKTPRAGVVISHDWMGLGDFAKGQVSRCAPICGRLGHGTRCSCGCCSGCRC